MSQIVQAPTPVLPSVGSNPFSAWLDIPGGDAIAIGLVVLLGIVALVRGRGRAGGGGGGGGAGWDGGSDDGGGGD